MEEKDKKQEVKKEKLKLVEGEISQQKSNVKKPKYPSPSVEKKTEQKIKEEIKQQTKEEHIPAIPIAEPPRAKIEIRVNDKNLTVDDIDRIQKELEKLKETSKRIGPMTTGEYFSTPHPPEPKKEKYKRKKRDHIPKLWREEKPPSHPTDPKPPEDRKKVAIVGFADTTRMKAPFNDPTFEIWGLNELYMIIPRADRWFEIHCDHNIKHSFRDPSHWEWLKKCKMPVYMTRKHKEISTSIAWPKDQMVKIFGPIFSSSIAEMIATAIVEGFEEIHLYGVDMALKKEYGAQKSAVEELVGIAIGLGIDVYIPPESDILKYGFIYGYDDPHVFAVKMKEKNIELRGKLARARQAEQEAHDGSKMLEGALQLNDYYINNFVEQMASEQFKHQ